jgi:hypothetical protein
MTDSRLPRIRDDAGLSRADNLDDGDGVSPESPRALHPGSKEAAQIMSGGRRRTERDERAWLLDCDGMRVEAADRLVGVVVAPLYEFSARWDRPWALSVRTDTGAAIVRMETIEAVYPEEGRIVVRDSPLVDLDVPPAV